MAAATAAVVVGAVGLISGFLGSRKASKAAKKQAKIEAEQEKLITAERVRQIGKEERDLYGETIAGYTGGGVLASFGSTQDTALDPLGSAASVLAEQKEEFGFERKITQETGASNVMQSLQRGRALSNQYKYQGYANLAGGISNLLTGFG